MSDKPVPAAAAAAAISPEAAVRLRHGYEWPLIHPEERERLIAGEVQRRLRRAAVIAAADEAGL